LSKRRKLHFSRVLLVLGESDITLGYALTVRILQSKEDSQMRAVDLPDCRTG
jgi:hypothetical protein